MNNEASHTSVLQYKYSLVQNIMLENEGSL